MGPKPTAGGNFDYAICSRRKALHCLLAALELHHLKAGQSTFRSASGLQTLRLSGTPRDSAKARAGHKHLNLSVLKLAEDTRHCRRLPPPVKVDYIS